MATAAGSSSQTQQKRRRYEMLVRKYFIQLTEGCGNTDCTNSNCATGSGTCMGQNEAAAKAMSIVHKSKKVRMCLPDEGAIPQSNSKAPQVLNSYYITITPSDSSATLSVKESRSSNSDFLEPMETTDSFESIPLEKSHSNCGSAASSGIVQMNSSESSVAVEDAPTQQSVIIPSDIGVSSSSNDDTDSIVGHGFSQNSDVVVPTYMSRVSPRSSGDVVRMDLSPSVPSGPSFTVHHTHIPKDALHVSLPNSSIGSNFILETLVLNEELVYELIDQGQSSDVPDYKELTNRLWLIFSSPDSLNRSFQLSEEDVGPIGKETGICVDLKGIRRTYATIFELESNRVQNTLVNAMEMYKGYLQRVKSFKINESLSHFVILMENPLLSSPEFLTCYSKLLRAIESLPVPQKEHLIKWYSYYQVDELIQFIKALQQLITLQLLFSDESEHSRYYIPQADTAIAAASGVMGLFFFSSLLKAKREDNMKDFTSSLNSFMTKTKPEFMQASDSDYEQLILRLQVHPCLIKKFSIPLSEFINEELNERIDMSKDYHREYTSNIGEKNFSFLEHPYMLTVTNKVEKLYRDNLVSMFSERHRSVIHSVLTGVADVPYLALRVCRESIVEDALVQLEAIAELNPIDLRKQLRVEFNGEDGVDEGGLQKEFFQLLIEKLFDPMYGLFSFDDNTQEHWINPTSLESDGEYNLIGLLLGLAIYNNVILDIRFPIVIYRKLLGCPVDFSDLCSSHPVIARSLQSLLDSQEEDLQKFQDSFMLNFEVSHLDMFGNEIKHELKENGREVPVTRENRQEFVCLYTDWLLNTNIHQKFKAFKQGFDLVMSQSCLADLVIPEELELIICGSTEWDIDALEDSTRYDGFSPRHPVIMNFWEIVRDFSDTQRKRLLAFITGSDRIPLGGLSKLKLIIVKNGPDSDRLPTAHTCFNALLLCEYSSKEKLKERLVKATSNSMGFGMI